MNLSKQFLSFAAACAASALMADPMQVLDVSMAQDSGYSTLTVTYTLSADAPAFVRLDVLTNGVSIGKENLKSLSGDGYSTDIDTLIPAGLRRQIVWQAKKDWPEHISSNAQARVMAYYTNSLAYVPGVYMVVDLSGGPNAASYPISYTLTPPDLTDTACCSNQLWLKRVETNTFVMGSAESEIGRDTDETQHSVTLTKAFFVGVFPVTVAQYQLVTGSTPSQASKTPNALCPVNQVSYNDLRGTSLGSRWPATNAVDDASFFGILRAKTGNLLFDLPTEAQWEYACRAGTTGAWNNGTASTGANTDPELGKLGWYSANSSNTTHPVGHWTPNAWGLYDCHGNVWEWCLDWYGAYGTGAAIDPVGPASSSESTSHRLMRGGAFGYYASNCRSANRDNTAVPTARYYGLGFRIAFTLGQ